MRTPRPGSPSPISSRRELVLRPSERGLEQPVVANAGPSAVFPQLSLMNCVEHLAGHPPRLATPARHALSSLTSRSCLPRSSSKIATIGILARPRTSKRITGKGYTARNLSGFDRHERFHSIELRFELGRERPVTLYARVDVSEL